MIMISAIASEIDALQKMTTNELLERYAELHGQPSRTRHRTYLIRKKSLADSGQCRRRPLRTGAKACC